MSKAIKLSRLFCVVVLSQWMTACVGFSPALNPGASKETGMGYIYGRFTAVDPSPGFYGPPLRMGLVVSSQERSETVTIEFADSGNISAFAVKPGTYALQKIIFAGQYEPAQSVKEALASSNVTFHVEPGKAYYLGDFRGRVWGTFLSREEERLKAVVDDVVSNYKKTTVDLHRGFPALKEVETVQVIE